MDIIILMLVTWRISSLLVDEKGPFNIFEWFRISIQNVPLLNGLFSCIWCMSIWVGLILTGVHWYSPNVSFWLCLPFALSAGAIIVNKVING